MVISKRRILEYATLSPTISPVANNPATAPTFADSSDIQYSNNIPQPLLISLIVSGTLIIVYWFLILLLRFLEKRQGKYKVQDNL